MLGIFAALHQLIRHAEGSGESSPDEELHFPWNLKSMTARCLWLAVFVITEVAVTVVVSRLLARWTASTESSVNTHFLIFLAVLLPVTTGLTAVLAFRRLN